MESRECSACEEAISPARLKANPQAELCINCQEHAEKAGRFKRHSMTQKVEFSRDGAEVESSEFVLVRGDKT